MQAMFEWKKNRAQTFLLEFKTTMTSRQKKYVFACAIHLDCIETAIILPLIELGISKQNIQAIFRSFLAYQISF